jgi:hypothetical protein
MAMRPAPQRRKPAGQHFRSEIEAAELQGFAREALVLRLTLNDVNALKRDSSLAVADISFADGVMKYLGVRIEPGGVPESVLERPA